MGAKRKAECGGFLKARGVLEKDFADPQKVERRVVGETEERLYFLLIYILKRVDARSGEFLSRIFSVYHEPAHSHHTGRLRRLGRGYSDFTMRQLGFPGVRIHGPRPFNFLTCPAAVPLTHRTPVGFFSNRPHINDNGVPAQALVIVGLSKSERPSSALGKISAGR